MRNKNKKKKKNKNKNTNSIDMKDFRPPRPYLYPIHNHGPLIEEYFYNHYQNLAECPFDYLPVFWTNIYMIMTKYSTRKPPVSLQDFLNSLDKDKKYFTVVQHDNGIQEKIPDNVLIFGSGGSNSHIPIPLLCNNHPAENKKRDIFASFVGIINNKNNDKHDVRKKMRDIVFTSQNYDFYYTESSNDIAEFEQIMNRSIFALCPRGFGKTSFRMYEAIQMGCIPVYIYDDPWLPYEQEINWEDFSVSCHVDDLSYLPDILHSYSEEKIKKMQLVLHKYYSRYFTFESVYKNIIQMVNFVDEHNISIGDDTYKQLIRKTNILRNKDRKITFAVAAYNEFSDIHPGQSITECIRWPLQDDRIDEIVISDDCSEHFDKLQNLVQDLPKVKLYRNDKNLGTFGNKKKVVSLSSNDWVILFDSDNICDETYVDNLYATKWDKDTIYHPVYASPKFDYRDQNGEIWTIEKSPMLVKKYGKSLTNMGNFFFNRNMYMEILFSYPYERFDLSLPNYYNLHKHIRKDLYWRLVFDPYDAIFVFKEWLFYGNKIKMIKDQQYFHLVSSDSTCIKSPKEKICMHEYYMEELSRRQKFTRTIDIIEYLHCNCWNQNHADYNLYPWEFYKIIYNLLIPDRVNHITQIGCFTLFVPRIVHEIIKAKPEVKYHVHSHAFEIDRGVFGYTDECCPHVYNHSKFNNKLSDILIMEDNFASNSWDKDILSFCQNYNNNIIYICNLKEKTTNFYHDISNLGGKITSLLIKDNKKEYLLMLVSPEGLSCLNL